MQLSKKIMFAVLLCVVSTSTASEITVAHDYSKVTEDQKLNFVMLAPFAPEREQELLRSRTLSHAGFDKNLRRKYPQSGLYARNGSSQPLWTVNWYAYPAEVKVSADGQHLVRINTFPKWNRRFESDALVFYRKGKEIKRYQIKDIMAPENMGIAEGYLLWLRGVVFDDKKGIVKVSTRREPTLGDANKIGRQHTFDIRSGAISTKN